MADKGLVSMADLGKRGLIGHLADDEEKMAKQSCLFSDCFGRDG